MTCGIRAKVSFRIALSNRERAVLEAWQRSTKMPIGLVKRGQIILLLVEGKSAREASRIVGIAKHHVYKWARRFIASGLKGLYRAPHIKIRKAEDKTIQSALFSILHSPPSEYNINRTSWVMGELRWGKNVGAVSRPRIFT